MLELRDIYKKGETAVWPCNFVAAPFHFLHDWADFFPLSKQENLFHWRSRQSEKKPFGKTFRSRSLCLFKKQDWKGTFQSEKKLCVTDSGQIRKSLFQFIFITIIKLKKLPQGQRKSFFFFENAAGNFLFCGKNEEPTSLYRNGH